MPTAKKTYQCSACKANHVQWYGCCHFCKSWNKIEEVAVATKVDKSDWYDIRIQWELKHGLCTCDNCGKAIKYQLKSKDTWVSRGAICHILPKSKFPSIALNINNYFVGCLACHSDYDSSWDKASKMQVFALAKKKFKILKPLITESLTKIEKYFE